MTTISNNIIAESIYLGVKDKNNTELSSYFKNVVKFLNKRKLIPKKTGILSALQKIVNKENSIVEANIFSVNKLSVELKQSLVASLQKRYRVKDVILHETVDETLLGGFRVEVEDEIIDLSIRNRISKLKEHLIRKV